MQAISYSLTTAWCVIGLLAFVGCGSEASLDTGPVGTVRGRVTYQGKAVPEGSIINFGAEDGLRLVSAEIGSDGEFVATNVPTGTVRVSVSPPSVEEEGAEPADPNVIATPPFPERYLNPEASGETINLTEGQEVEYNLEMTDG
jgi:hypothetical protein